MKNKKFKLLLCLVLVVALLFSSVGCDKGGKDDDKNGDDVLYQIVFLDDNDEVLLSVNLALGTLIYPYTPAAPSKDGWSFAGWDGGYSNDMTVAGNHTFKAIYTQLFLVRFLDADGTVLLSVDLALGASIYQYTPTTPSKDGWSFAGWDGGYSNDMTVTGNHTFTATYVKKFTVVFFDADGETVIKSVEAAAGTIISTLFPEPPTAQQGETFVGWDGYVSGMTVTDNHAFKAIYDTDSVTYTLTFFDDDGETVIMSVKAAVDTEVELYLPSKPSKQYHSFVRWNGLISGMKVTGNHTFTAVYERLYTVKFLDDDNTVLNSIDVREGALISTLLPASPTKNGHNFSHWNGYESGMTVTGDHIFTAVYKRLYTVKFLDDDNTVLKSTDVSEGTLVSTLFPTAPSKEGRTFSRWSGYVAGMTVTDDHTFKAIYIFNVDPFINDYTTFTEVLDAAKVDGKPILIFFSQVG